MVFENAKWIWGNLDFSENEYSEFLEKIDFSDERVIFRISVTGDYTLFINGKYAKSNQYGDFPHYKVYDEIDITDYLKKGENRISLLSWYFGKSGMRYHTPVAGVIFEAVADGKVILSSDENTLSRKSLAYLSGSDKKITNQLGYSFTYDATKEDMWLDESMDGFKKSFVTMENVEVFKRPIKKLCLKPSIKGKITKTESSYIIDFGREIVGLAHLDFISGKAQKINVAYGEILKDGHVKRKIDGRDFSFDYIAKRGENQYTNYMFRLGLRYIEITFEEEILINSVEMIPEVYPANPKEIPELSKDDRDIYEICLNTLKLCMMEHYVDCPWREQCMYAYDSRNQMLAGYYAFCDKNQDYARANLLLMSKDEREDDLLSICFPSREKLSIPTFSLYYILAVKEYVEHTFDLSLAKEVIGKIERILDKFIKTRKDGLVTKFAGDDYWNFYDWSEYLESEFGGNDDSADLMVNAITLVALDSYKYIVEKLGTENKFLGIDEEIKLKAREKFLNPETGLYFIHKRDEKPTELANSLAVLTGIATKDETDKISEKLANGELIECSLSMKAFKYDALLKNNREKYKDSVLSEIRKTYKTMVDSGLGTVWETIEGETAFDNAGSLCHGWSAIPIYYFDILGE